jgi:hypothetical protein
MEEQFNDLKCNYIHPEIQTASVNLYPCINTPSFQHNVYPYKTLSYQDHIFFNRQNPSYLVSIPKPKLCAGNFVNEHYEERYSDKNDSLIEAFDVDGGPGVKDLQGRPADINFTLCEKNKKQIQVCRHCTTSFKKPNIHDPCFSKGKTFGGIDKDGSYKCI